MDDRSGTETEPTATGGTAMSPREILERHRTVAVVGASPDPWRPSNSILQDLLVHGYRAFPVHPEATEIHGQPVHADLASIGEPVELVVLFRNPDAVPEHVEEALEIGAQAIWMQPGAVNEAAATRARDAGVPVVAGACVARELARSGRD